ncbi:MAG: HesA/MoeB/ThiF family protein [Candidatus Atribacteria bacterium]|nr:HesA/MoeB/ThiF family protein [Candidatus Atribacteria bacterium]
MVREITALKKELGQLKKSLSTDEDTSPIISINEITNLAQKYKLSAKEIEIASLKEGIIPIRYKRNFNTLNFTDQIKLLSSKVAVIGCGGLGGSIIELLARLGIGTIIAVDGDTFSESNLNRQQLCIENCLGRQKTQTVIDRIKAINSGIEVIPYCQFVDEKNISKIIEDADIIVDGLDNIPARFMVENACKKLKIPFIHGAVSGLQGQVATIFPEDVGLTAIYGPLQKYHQETAEKPVSVLSVTPSLIASLQVTEVLKVLLQRGKPLRNKLLLINLENSGFDIVKIN